MPELMDIPFRRTCKGCGYERYCYFEPRTKMFDRKCYVDFLSEKMKVKPKVFLKRCYSFMKKYGIEFDVNYHFKDKEYFWKEQSNRERLTYIQDYLSWLIRNSPEISYTRSDGKLYCAFVDTYFNSWRNEEYIPCAKCGKIIKNSKQRNRKFCDDCAGYQKLDDNYAVCSECGEEFLRISNSQYRCPICQKEADKSSARDRARRYRERKNHGFNLKS
ncbi:MAG: hypothetical protein II304_01140 [Bacteroidales bacterium]|nr:hypothetical protein [Bacteroidales bacterium]